MKLLIVQFSAATRYLLLPRSKCSKKAQSMFFP